MTKIDSPKTGPAVESASTKSQNVPAGKTARGRKWWLWGGLLVLLAAAAVFAAATLGDGEEVASSDNEPNTAEVSIRDLADETTYDATLGRPVAGQLTAGITGTVTWVPEAGTVISSGGALFAIDDTPVLLMDGDVPAYRSFQLGEDTITLPAGVNGVLTWLPDVGTILESGDVIARVDNSPIVLLEGDLPMYRTLREGVEGEDVLQLEQALVALGYDSDETVTVDEDFTSVTENMVERWQEDLGIDETGRISVGEVIFAPVPAQIVSHQAVVGSSVNSSTPVMQATGGTLLSGSDVLQLEEALADLGYNPGSVDGTYDIDTALAVSAWTDDGGHGRDGLLVVGSVVFNSGDLRTAEVFADVGTAVNASSPVISAADLETIVRLDLPAEDQDLLSVGSSVVIVMPDRSETGGTVTFVSSVATDGGPGSPATFDVEIELDDPSVAEGLDEAPVDVRAVSEAVEDVLAVPVSALLALAEGGYAVEIVDGAGTKLVAVDPGFFADGWVEITGNVQVGDIVVVP
ncbi:MAG: peptidoglycan-binding protein [Actinomycetota bacterium]|nr:peptidoglycan-binding protein [Actinomycetota bacterium]